MCVVCVRCVSECVCGVFWRVCVCLGVCGECLACVCGVCACVSVRCVSECVCAVCFGVCVCVSACVCGVFWRVLSVCVWWL